MENRMVSANSTVLESPSLMVQANIVFLKTKLVAAYEKVGSGYKILVKPTDAAASKMSISDMIGEVNKMISGITGEAGLKDTDITDKIKDFYSTEQNGNLLDNIEISLKQVFLYIDKSHENQDENTMEYAFDLEIINEVTKGLEFINLETISLAIWNSKRQSVLDRMDMKKLDDLIKDYS